MTRYFFLIIGTIIIGLNFAEAQEINEYVVKRTLSPLTIDGSISEPEWEAALLTEKFVKYTDGSAQQYPTQAKMLWDDNFLYIALICEDPDVWATYENRDSYLWEEDVAEMFIDPDGDGLNYPELQVNPLGTQMDLLMSKAYSEGGKGDFNWNLDGFTAAVGVEGTINNKDDTDTRWICEVALPFEGLAFSAPSLSFPPEDGDSWRLNLYRYEYFRDGSNNMELSAWNQTDERGFHAPDKFGRVIFSDESVPDPNFADDAGVYPDAFKITGNYPNPFNLATLIEFSVHTAGVVKLEVYNVLGQYCRTVMSGFYQPGIHSVVWNGKNADGEVLTSGVYIARLQMGPHVSTCLMLMVK